jgi:putative addiction module killer protein
MMIEIRRSEVFVRWFRALGDRRAQERISKRLSRLYYGLLGDAKSVGNGVTELRIDYGPGYRLYLMRRGTVMIVLLCGGDKQSQRRDIDRAKAMADDIEHNGMEDGSWQ